MPDDVPPDDPAPDRGTPDHGATSHGATDHGAPDRSRPDHTEPEHGPDPEALRLAGDPATDPAALAHLAYDVPETRALVAANPSAYPDLVEWLAQFEDPAVQAALAARSVTVDGGRGAGSASSSTVRVFGRDLPRRTVQIVAGVTAGVVLLGIVSGVVIGLGGSRSSDVQSAAEEDAVAVVGPSDEALAPDDEPTTEESPTPSGPTAAELGRTWTTTFSRDGGYTEDVSFALGDPEHVGTHHPDDPALVGGDTCGADPTTDAVVPLRFSVTSRTAGFTTQVGASLQFQVDPEAPMAAEGLEIEGAYSSAPSCDGPAAYSNTITTMSLQSTASDLEDGHGVVLDGWLVLHGYYSPAAPDGDASLLDAVSLAFGSSTTDNSGVWDRTGADVTVDRGDGQDPTTSDDWRWTLTGEGSRS